MGTKKGKKDKRSSQLKNKLAKLPEWKRKQRSNVKKYQPIG
jgi:hypothetical protein